MIKYHKEVIILEKGLIHIYYGGGRGKTTAAVGMAIRMSGSGGRVVFMQYLKGAKTSERKILAKTENIRLIDVPDSIKFVFGMNEDEIARAREYYNGKTDEIEKIIDKGDCDMLILDEVLDAADCGIIEKERVVRLADMCRGRVELILTGRNPDEQILRRGDYITEMCAVRHPFDSGIGAREGIEY